jgi:peptide/nickel transport system ATP-binding protein
MEPLLRIEDLSLEFVSGSDRHLALDKISFSLHSGEILALVGESGSGKSVTSLSILQLLPKATSYYKNGSIRFCAPGQSAIEMIGLPSNRLQQIRGAGIGMVFQEPMSSLNPVMRCGEQVMEAIQIHRKVAAKTAQEEVLHWFEKVKLPDPAGTFQKYPHQLSGGQKQRVMIAMAMCCHPSLLICDEPTTALDVTVQKTILELLKALQAETGMGIIFITHDLGVVSEIADRAVVMYRGRIVEQGKVADLFQKPAHPYTKGLLACRPALHARGSRLPTVGDFMEEKITYLPDPAIIPTKDQPSPEHSPVLMEVRNLSVDYTIGRNWLGQPTKTFRALDNLHFDVMSGETLGLVGESGCGKTTLGRTLLRLIDASTGTITYKGESLLFKSNRDMRTLRRHLQIIFQDPFSSLNPRIPIGQAIAEPLKVHAIETSAGTRKEKVIHLLEKVGLSAAHYNRYPHEFSGGQRQRIVIARALGLQPEFLVCDESVSALDVSVQAQILNLLNDLKSEFGFTILFISHDLSVIRYFSDRIMVMQNGRIVESGPSESLYREPKSPYTQQLIDSIPGKIRATR